MKKFIFKTEKSYFKKVKERKGNSKFLFNIGFVLINIGLMYLSFEAFTKRPKKSIKVQVLNVKKPLIKTTANKSKFTNLTEDQIFEIKMNRDYIDILSFMGEKYWSTIKDSKISARKYQTLINKGIGMCLFGKNENNYIREYLSYYNKLGVSRFYIYDNNEPFGENFEDVLKEEIDKKIVEIIYVRGVTNFLAHAQTDCYDKFGNRNDWLIFVDFDEFIYLEDGTLTNFLSNSKFERCQAIKLNSVYYTDNNLMRYSNDFILNRFTKEYKGSNEDILKEKRLVKSIIRGGLGRVRVHVNSALNLENSCNEQGEIVDEKSIEIEPSMKNAYLKKYTKTAEEYCQKIIDNIYDSIPRGVVISNETKVEHFFKINKFSEQKLKIFENCLNTDLKSIRQKFLDN